MGAGNRSIQHENALQGRDGGSWECRIGGGVSKQTIAKLLSWRVQSRSATQNTARPPASSRRCASWWCTRVSVQYSEYGWRYSLIGDCVWRAWIVEDCLLILVSVPFFTFLASRFCREAFGRMNQLLVYPGALCLADRPKPEGGNQCGRA